jgi:2-oxoglutarate dehydrogenase E2 component (dihydrolipoamide succinyltransferase)
MIEVKIPSPGESITEVEIANWLVQTGDYVEKDQELAEIESDKATLPLVAEESGKIEIIAPEGETIKVGEVACKIDETAKKEEGSTGQKEDQKTSKKTEEKEIEEDSKEQTTSPKQEEEKEDKTADTNKAKSEEEAEETDQVKVSPVAKKMMEDYNLSMDDVLKGLRRLNKKDIEKAREGLTKSPGEGEKGFEEISRETDRKKMTQLRKKLSERLVSVKNETAMLTTFNEVDMTEVINLRKKYQKAFQEKHGIKLGFMSFFTKAATRALEAYPNVNSSIDGEEIVYPRYKDIGIAVQTNKGLMVPVVRNAESLTLAEIELKINEYATKARNNKISIDEMQGGTFTITNGGVFGSLLSTPIINPPQSGILGMHNIQERPVAVNGQVEIRPMMYIALSYDHRTVDGKDSVSFLVKVKEMIENPHKMLLNEDPDKALLDL